MYTHKCIDYKCIRTKWGKVKIEQKTNKKQNGIHGCSIISHE